MPTLPAGLGTLSDNHRQTYSEISLTVGGYELWEYALYAETTFDMSAASQQGTCSISLKDPNKELGFRGGEEIVLRIDGQDVWRGFLMNVVMGNFFPAGDAPNHKTRKWILRGVDYNILFDKIVMYNKRDPSQPLGPTGRIPKYPSRYGWPQHTPDRDYLLWEIENDSDLGLIADGQIDFKSQITQVGTINPDGDGSPVNAGANLRALFEDVAGIVKASQPGSVIFYFDQNRRLIYKDRDNISAPFSVSDNPAAEVSCRDLVITTDISRIKNDVLVFSTELGYDAATLKNPKPVFKWVHNSLTDSVNKYGRWQWSETTNHWTTGWLRARSNKLLTQEGTPAVRAEFTIFRPGLYPGQIMTLSSDEFGFSQPVPIRSISISFDSTNFARFRVLASFDTQDPWGLLLALKRPAQRGMTETSFITYDLTRLGNAPIPKVPEYAYITEKPRAIGSRKYECAYGYIRNSIQAWVGGRALIPGGTSGLTAFGSGTFQELDPNDGIIQLYDDPAGDQVVVTYHASRNKN